MNPVIPRASSPIPNPDRPPRWGLYGGSFDPLHCGHLLVAQAALEELALDRLFFIPAAQSPFKPDSRPAPDAARLRMLRRSLAGQSRTEVHDDELSRGGVSYSIDTVNTFTARHPEAELFWLIGADHVPTLPQWREAEALAKAVTFVVIQDPANLRLPALALATASPAWVAARHFLVGGPGPDPSGASFRAPSARRRGRRHRL